MPHKGTIKTLIDFKIKIIKTSVLINERRRKSKRGKEGFFPVLLMLGKYVPDQTSGNFWVGKKTVPKALSCLVFFLPVYTSNFHPN